MLKRALFAVLWIAVLAAPLCAAVGHGTTAANLARLTAGVEPKAKGASAAGEAGGWAGGILALEGFRQLARPLTSLLGSGPVARIATELISGAAFKVGMDAGSDLLGSGTVRKPDWLEVGGAAAGMVVGGLLGKPLGPIGEAIGSWLGWSFGENLVKNYRAGKGWNLVEAAKSIDLPRLALQAVATEGAGLIARPLAGRVLGLGGAAGTIASIALQIGLTVGASAVASKIGDDLLGSEDEAPEAASQLPSLEAETQEAYRRFVAASRNPATGQPELAKALADYRSARSRLAAAKAATGP